MKQHCNKVDCVQPNPSGEANTSTSRPTSAAVNGHAHNHRTAGARIVTVPRSLRVQLVGLDDKQWLELRSLARESARFCNLVLADHFVRAMGYPDHEVSAFRRSSDKLSGDVRVALAREAFTTWRRNGRLIKSGDERLGLFRLDRALVCRGEHMSKGVRQRHAVITWNGTEFSLSLRLVPEKVGGRHEFKLWFKPQNESYVTPILHRFASGDLRLLKVSFKFERPGRKIFAFLSYRLDVHVPAFGSRRATIGPLEENGEVWLRIESESGRLRNFCYSHKIARLIHVKEHFAGIQARIRRTRRKTGPKHKRDYRNQLIKSGSFSEWANSYFLHEWSREIVGELASGGVGYLAIGPMAFGELPMANLIEKIKSKCDAAGIELVPFDPVENTSKQAIDRPVARKRRSIANKRKALSVLKEDL